MMDAREGILPVVVAETSLFPLIFQKTEIIFHYCLNYHRLGLQLLYMCTVWFNLYDFLG